MILLFALSIGGCRRDPTAQKKEEGEHALTIEDARMFYLADFAKDLSLFGDRNGAGGWTNNSSGTRSIADDPLAGIQPDWTQARYSELLGEEVVEVPFEELGLSVVFSTDTISNTLPPAQNAIVKLIAGVDERGGLYFNVVYISFTDEYTQKLEDRGILMRSLTLADLDSEFSGAIRRYTVANEFVGGQVIENADVVGSISAPDSQISDEPNMLIQRCYYYSARTYVWVWTPVTTGTPGNDGTNTTVVDASWDGWWKEVITYYIFCIEGDNPGNPGPGTEGSEGPGPGSDGPGTPNNPRNNDDKDPPEEPDIKPILKISLQQKTVELCEQFTVTVTVKPDTLSRIPITLSAGVGGQQSITPNFPQSFYALAPGNHTLKASMNYKGQTYSVSTGLAVRFPAVSANSTAAVDAVSKQMTDLWNTTVANATTTSQREYVMAIYVTATSGGLQYEAGEPVAGPPSDYTSGTAPGFSITPNETNGTLFDGGGRWIVAIVHTHPPLWNAPAGKHRSPGISDKDLIESQNNHMPYIVMDLRGRYDPEYKEILIKPSDPRDTPIALTYSTNDRRGE